MLNSLSPVRVTAKREQEDFAIALAKAEAIMRHGEHGEERDLAEHIYTSAKKAKKLMKALARRAAWDIAREIVEANVSGDGRHS